MPESIFKFFFMIPNILCMFLTPEALSAEDGKASQSSQFRKK